MSSNPSPPISSHGTSQENNAMFFAGRPLACIVTVIVISFTLLYVFASQLKRKYASNLNIGKFGFLNLKEIEWKSYHASIKDRVIFSKTGLTSSEEGFDLNESLKITVNSIGLRFGSNEGSRRQWIALRIDSPHIQLPKRYIQSHSSDLPSYESESEVSSPGANYRHQHNHIVSDADSALRPSSVPRRVINLFQHLSSIFAHARSYIIRRLPPRFLPALRFLRKLLRIARLHVVRPLLNKLNRFGRRLSWIISIFGLEINDIVIQVNEICKIKCSIKIGLQMSRGDQGEICCWLIIKKLEIKQAITANTTTLGKEDSRLHGDNVDGTTAFHFPGSVEISASAGLDPVIGLASILAGSKGMGYSQGMSSSFYPNCHLPTRSWKYHIRPRSVIITLEVIKQLTSALPISKKGDLPPNLRGISTFISVQNLMAIVRAIPPRARTDANEPMTNEEPVFPSRGFSTSSLEGENSPSNSFSVVSIIKQFQISLPFLHCRYILAGNIPDTSLPDSIPGRQSKTMAIDLEISKFFMNLDLSAKKTGKDSSQSSTESTTHLEWFGRGTSIPLRFDSQWKDVIINATLLSDSPGSLDTNRNGPTQLLRISEFSCILSSSWLPRTMREKIHFDDCSFLPTCYTRMHSEPNDNMMVAEFEIGKIRGQMPIENLLILHSLSRANAPVQSNSNSYRNKPPANSRREDVPKLIFGLSIQSVQYDLHGPANKHTSTLHSTPTNTLGKNSSNLSSSTAVLSISISSFHFNSTGEYVDLTVKRSEAVRRAAKIKARRNEVYVPTSLRGIKISQAHEESVLLEKRDMDKESDKRTLDYSKDVYRRSTQRDVGPHHQAYPLPNPSPLLPQLKSRVDILREMSLVEFLYQLSFTWQIHSINVLFQDDAKSERSCHPFAFESPTRIPSPGPYEFITLKSMEVFSEFSFAGRNFYCFERKLVVPMIDLLLREGTVQEVIEDISIESWRPNLLANLVIFTQTFSSFYRNSHPQKDNIQPSRAKSRTIPLPRDIAFSLAVTQFRFYAGGFDPKADLRRPRGIKLVLSNLLLECFRLSSAPSALYSSPHRARLALQEDIRVQANTHLMHNPEYDSCFLKCIMNAIEIFPISDLNDSLRSDRFFKDQSTKNLPMFHSRSPTPWDDELRNRQSVLSVVPSTLDEYEKSVYENEGVSIVEIKRFACRTTFQILKKPEIGKDELILAVETNSVTFHINVFNIYCGLISISTLLNLSKSIASNQIGRVKHHSKSPSYLSVGIRAEVSRANFHLSLSPDVAIYIEMRRISCRQSSKLGFDARCDTLLLAGRTVTSPGRWDDLLKIKTCQVKVLQIGTSNPSSGPMNRGWHPFIVIVEGDAARLRIPFKFMIAEVLDNMSLLIKTTKHLIHQFIRGDSGSALQPQVELPKKIPEIRIKFRIICVAAEDDPFENKLNAIRRVGKEEVKDRLARDASFQQKVQVMKEAAKNPESRRSWESNRHSDRSSSDSRGYDDNASFDSANFKRSSPHSHVPIAQATQRLDEYNASAWIKRIRNALSEQERQEDAFHRQLYGHSATKSTDTLIPMTSPTKATPLVRVVFNSIRIALYKADCEKNENGLMDYLHRVGKGLPIDTKFSLIVPMHISWQMEGATIRLRDFPIYLFSLPRPQAQNGRQQERDLTQYTWQFESDFVIAEEMCGIESIRTIQSVVIPPHHSSDGHAHTLDVPKSVMPVKTYADPSIKLKSTAPVQLGWGNSMQPTVQDMMRVLESVTKPPVDLSDRVGFWDKVRLSLHWRVEISFMGSKADVVLHLKGSRDPYELVGTGAGFVKVWRGNVKILLGHENDEQEFLQIKSDQYILGIPNLKDLINNAATGSGPVATATPAANYKRVYQHLSQGSDSDESDPEALTSRETEFIKILGKLTNGVRWGMGIVLERACSDNLNKTCNCHGPAFHRKCRIFTFKPHYQVVTTTPQFGRSPDGLVIDSYEDFRSDFIHFSISLTSPTEVGNRQKRPTGQNSLYFSAESFTHFWCWLKTFDSALALPIRQGSLFPSVQAPSKKFGRHVATIKYRFGISPLFLAHTYRYETQSDWASGKNVVLGLKAKISRFNVDLHSRAVETTMRKPEIKEPKKLIRKAFYQAEVECQDVEIKALTAVFQTPRKSTYANDIGLTADQDESETNSTWEEQLDDDSEFLVHPPGDEGPFSIYSGKLRTKDVEWIDLNDFSDVFFWPNSSTAQQPKIKMFDCLACPRISFLRRPSSTANHQSPTGNNSFSDGESISDGQLIERTKFGKEDTHTCFIGKAEDPMKVQVALIDARLKELDEQKFRTRLNAAAYHPQRPQDTSMLLQIEARIQTLKELRESMLNAKCALKRNSQPEGAARQTGNHTSEYSDTWTNGERYLLEMANQLADENSEWSSRLLVHNPSILISNSVRDILLKYYYSYAQRRAFMYHLSARAVKFILDLADQESSIPPNKTKKDFNRRKSRVRSFDYQTFDGRPTSTSSMGTKSMPPFPEDGSPGSSFPSRIEEQAEQDIPEDFLVDPADLILLVRPQIAFRSEIDDISTVILTAFHAQVKSFEILDPSHLDDSVNATVMKRNFGTIKGFQMFYPCNTSALSSLHSTLEDQECHVPIEVLVDLRLEPWGFDRLIGRCTVNIAHDAFNQLRIKCRSAGADGSFSSATQPHLQTSTDLLRVEMADSGSVHATATHYRAIYNVITDLCLYTDPAQKKRNAALETMQFAYDVDDLAGMAEQIQQQQALIRLCRSKLDQEYVDMNLFDEVRMAELTQCEYQLWMYASDLNLMVEAIRRSQANRLGKSKAEKLPGYQLQANAKSITWYMLADSGEAIAKLSITGTRFESYTLPDTSVSNRLYLQDMLALNISADNDRQFDEILSRYEPYNSLGTVVNPKQFLTVVWKTLPSIAGISIIESFLLEIHPIRVQVEHAIGVKVHDYLFAPKSAVRENDNDSDEQTNSLETSTSTFPISEGEQVKKLHHKRSMIMNLYQSKTRPLSPDVSDRRYKSVFKVPSRESLLDLSLAGRSRVADTSGFLNADWRSTSQTGSAHSTASCRVSRAPSVCSSSSDARRHAVPLSVTPNVLLNWNKQKTEDATEMKKRAQLYKSFLFIDVAPTVLCVSYSGPKYPDIFDLVVKVPPFHFESRTWSYSEFFDEIRRTCVSSLFKQSPSILGQIITTARKNRSVPKLMGQKMASGFKFKKRNLFERGHSTAFSHSRSATTASSSSTSGHYSSTNTAGTTTDQGKSPTLHDGRLLQIPHSHYLDSYAFGSIDSDNSPDARETTPRPSDMNPPTTANTDSNTYKSFNDQHNIDQAQLHILPHAENSLTSLDQRTKTSGLLFPSMPRGRRQSHKRTSTLDENEQSRLRSSHQRRQSEGPPASRKRFSPPTEPLPSNSFSMTHFSSSHG